MLQKMAERPRMKTMGEDSVDKDVTSPDKSCDSTREQETRRLKINFSLALDVPQITLVFIAMCTRFWRIGHPPVTVFDEVNYARYVSMYLQNTFFFDTAPPLGKLILAAAAFPFGMGSAESTYDSVGEEYDPSVPIIALRSVPAMFGSLTVGIAYETMLELGFTQFTASLAGLLIILENAMLTQSRFMFVDSMLVFFIGLTLLAVVKFKKENAFSQFSLQWWFSLSLIGISFSSALCIKHTGCLTVLMAAGLVGHNFWETLPSTANKTKLLLKNVAARFAMLFILPCLLYIGVYYIHLTVLHKAGPHDTVMTSAFQASLEGGLAAITKGQPLQVAYGSQVTLRRTHGDPCWLHSHLEVYPLRYDDGRGSSHQQQVTCYSYKDVNNWWFIKDPNSDQIQLSDPPVPVKHGDVIQIVHGITSRALNSHNVAAPLTASCQEVSCFIDYNVSMEAENYWQVEIINRETDRDEWQTIRSHVRLVHVNTSSVLRTTGKTLPDWGFLQMEVATDRSNIGDSSVWNVEEHQYPKVTNNKDNKKEKIEDGSFKVQLHDSTLIPLEATQLPFFTKFRELFFKCVTSRHDANMEHRFSSEPFEWPFMTKNIAYWLDGQSALAQIHFIGNPVLWISGTCAVVAYAALLAFHLIRRRRLCRDISEEAWQQFVIMGQMFFAGYLVHYLPFYTLDRTLFIYCYLPALYFKILLLAAMSEHLTYLITSVKSRALYRCGLVVWFTLIVNAFLTFSVLSYGYKLPSVEGLNKLQWQESWDLLLEQLNV